MQIMPYIRMTDRDRLNQLTDEIQTVGLSNAGELNYLFTIIARTYLTDNGLSYQNINDIIGALEGAKLELYRIVASPYEDNKIKENGDVYT